MRRLFGLFAFLVFLSGCGTYTECIHPPSEGPRIYGGVKTDMEIEGVLYADVPLSAVGDTLLLPYTGSIALFNDDEDGDEDKNDDDDEDEDLPRSSSGLGAE